MKLSTRITPSLVRCWGMGLVLLCAGVLAAGQVETTPTNADSAAAAGCFNITHFGAVGDGHTLNTNAFKRAVDAASSAGGGEVLVPPGHFLTGAIELKSHVQLNLSDGAVLLASQNAADYPLTENVWTSSNRLISSVIYAHDAQDVAVTGRGTIDGQGASWWAPILAAKGRRTRRAAPPTTAVAASPDGVAELPHGRPQLIRFVRCNNVLIDGITLLNSPEWNVHPLLCERVRVNGVTITAKVPSPNTDGINPESCRTVQISNCRIDNGDDCVTLKSGLDEAGRRMGRPDEDITITNCVMYHGHGGVTIGSEMSGGVHNVVVTNCVFHGTDNGVRIKSQRGRGGVVEGISISNIVMQDVPHPFVITSFYAGKDKPTDSFAVNEGTPQLRDISISNVSARGALDAGNITGLREMPIRDITFSNVHVESQHGMVCTNAAGVHFLDCAIDTTEGSSLTEKGCEGFDTARLRTDVPHDGAPLIAAPTQP